MAVTLSRDERDALRADVLFELTTVGDIAKAVRSGNAAEARRLRVCFEEGVRLLDDLGWEELEERESFTLTMPLERLEAMLRRFRDRAEEDLDSCRRELNVARHPWQKERDYEHALDSIRQEIDHNLDVRSACLTALEAVGAEEDR